MPILAKDEEKQRQIKEKALQDATSLTARAIGASTPATASRGVAVAGTKMSKLVPPSLKSTVVGTSVVMDGTDSVPTGVGAAQKSTSGATSSVGTNNMKNNDGSIAPKKIPMLIPAIPPYRGGKGKTSTTSTPGQGQTGTTASSNGSPAATGTATPASNGNLTKSASPAAAGTGSVPLSPTSATGNRLNVNASSFRPNPKANAFTPVIFVVFMLTVCSWSDLFFLYFSAVWILYLCCRLFLHQRRLVLLRVPCLHQSRRNQFVKL